MSFRKTCIVAKLKLFFFPVTGYKWKDSEPFVYICLVTFVVRFGCVDFPGKCMRDSALSLMYWDNESNFNYSVVAQAVLPLSVMCVRWTVCCSGDPECLVSVYTWELSCELLETPGLDPQKTGRVTILSDLAYGKPLFFTCTHNYEWLTVQFKQTLVKYFLEELCVSCKGNQHMSICSSLDTSLFLYSAAKNVFVKK